MTKDHSNRNSCLGWNFHSWCRLSFFFLCFLLPFKHFAVSQVKSCVDLTGVATQYPLHNCFFQCFLISAHRHGATFAQVCSFRPWVQCFLGSEMVSLQFYHHFCFVLASFPMVKCNTPNEPHKKQKQVKLDQASHQQRSKTPHAKSVASGENSRLKIPQCIGLKVENV